MPHFYVIKKENDILSIHLIHREAKEFFDSLDDKDVNVMRMNVDDKGRVITIDAIIFTSKH